MKYIILTSVPIWTDKEITEATGHTEENLDSQTSEIVSER